MKISKEQWIRIMYLRAKCDEKAKIDVKTQARQVDIYYSHSQYRIEVGCSYCHPDDSFNERIGIALAYARLTKEKIPQCVLEDKLFLSDVKIGQVFDRVSDQERYVKIQLVTVDGWTCTNIATGKHTIIHENEIVQIPFAD